MTESVIKTCPICGKQFEARHPQIVYCSIECRRKGLKKNRNEAVRRYHARTMGKVI